MAVAVNFSNSPQRRSQISFIFIVCVEGEGGMVVMVNPVAYEMWRSVCIMLLRPARGSSQRGNYANVKKDFRIGSSSSFFGNGETLCNSLSF